MPRRRRWIARLTLATTKSSLGFRVVRWQDSARRYRMTRGRSGTATTSESHPEFGANRPSQRVERIDTGPRESAPLLLPMLPGTLSKSSHGRESPISHSSFPRDWVAGCVRKPRFWGGMKRSHRDFPLRVWRRSLPAILALSLVSPSLVRAGCASRHLSFRSPSAPAIVHLELLSRVGALPTPHQESPREQPAPCSGALCSGNPAPPPSTLPTLPPPVGGQWAIPVALNNRFIPRWFVGLPIRGSLCPIEHSCSIFHPPRASVPTLAS